MTAPRAHIVHVVHRLDTGGMENGVVNLVNRLPAERYRHTIVPLTSAGAIAARITNRDVVVAPLGLPPGPLAAALPTLWRTFRALKPSIVHTRNVGTLEAQIAAALARVPVRIHGEHGWEVHDLVGSNAKLLRTRRWLRHFVHQQVALSMPTFEYLRDRVGVPAGRLTSICNGVNTERFRPRVAEQEHNELIVGYVGRLADVKNPLLLLEAFELAHERVARREPELASRLRLVFVGNGPLADDLRQRTESSPLHDAITLAGGRDDVAEQLRLFDVYALPSLAEGISNTLLEAMATGLPCVATRVGGNDELVEDGCSGTLVAPGDPHAFAEALATYLLEPPRRAAHGASARARAVDRFGIDRMVCAYDSLYAEWLVRRRAMPQGWPAAAGHASCSASHAMPHSSAS